MLATTGEEGSLAFGADPPAEAQAAATMARQAVMRRVMKVAPGSASVAAAAELNPEIAGVEEGGE